MKDLNYSISRLCAKHRDGSFSTQANRSRVLNKIATDLNDLGFRHLKRSDQFSPKHVWALVNMWKMDELSTGSIKNNMSHIRWLANKIGKPDLVAADNAKYGIDFRVVVSNTDKSLVFNPEQIERIADPHIKLSAELQMQFGLRREEAMKFKPCIADHGKHIILEGSWTKGGKKRDIPVRNIEQRELLDRVSSFVGKGSMIPSARSYVQHMRVFEKEMSKVGLGRTHGARHLYAQTRYRELTGREAPVVGGISRNEMTSEQREFDNECRLIISKELGHERMEIVAIYVGS